MEVMDVKDALAFVKTVRERKIPILGIDSFIVAKTSRSIMPMMDHILDMSDADATVDTWSVAERFLEDRRHLGFMFEIVV